MKIVVKVGTQSILSEGGEPLESTIESIVEQLAELQAQGHLIVLVSSGAVSFARCVARQILGKEYGISVAEKQLLASLGQHELMRVYARMFKKHNILVSQLLLTKQDFHTRQHYLNVSRLIREILEHRNIIPIINENDSVAVEELMFTDNDELAGLIAAQINADRLIILSNVEGVHTDHPDNPNSELIPVIGENNTWPNVSTLKTAHGRGGMASKINTARKMSNLGTRTHIASVHQPAVLTRLIANEHLGTTIIPSKKKSSIKRWIAYSFKQGTGKIVINKCLYEIFKENKRVVSILPIGIDKFQGEFIKGEIVEILTQQGQKIGIGLARYGSEKLKELLGQKNKPAFIHYDHLHLF